MTRLVLALVQVTMAESVSHIAPTGSACGNV